MALIIQNGDIFKSNTDAIVNPVNIQGKVRGGLANVFRKKFPENHRKYVAACKDGTLTMGKVLVTEGGGASRFIINLPTVRESGGSSHLMDIEMGMDALTDAVVEYQMKSVAIPAIGGGAGGLDFNLVKEVVENSTKLLPEVAFILYYPQLPRSSSPKPRRRRSRRKRPRYTLAILTALATAAGLAVFTVITVIIEIASRGLISKLFGLE